jgi:hypothetical protein
MTQEHPITPPPELVREWSQNRGYSCADELWDYLATQAARWGADQELEACCEWVSENVYLNHPFSSHDLRAARRPKPPSLKELNLKHLEVMERDSHYLPEIISDLRRAVESLPD